MKKSKNSVYSKLGKIFLKICIFLSLILIYRFLILDIDVNGEYYVNPIDNSTSVDIHIKNNGLISMKSLTLTFEPVCKEITGLHDTLMYPKLLFLPSTCGSKEDFLEKNVCELLKVDDEIIIGYESFYPLKEGCKFKIHYEVNWKTLYFRLWDSSYLTKKNMPTRYFRNYDSSVQFSHSLKAIRNFFYDGGQKVVKVNVVSPSNQNYTFTGEWFNSGTKFDESTFINFNEEKVNIMKNGNKSYYYWIPTTLPSDLSEMGFKSSIRTPSNEIYQKDIAISIVKDNELIPYLIQNSKIIFDRNSTVSALDRLRNSNDEKAQAEILLNYTREIILIPKEINRVKYYNEKDINSIESFYAREGTESEFNNVYVMFLRSIGIPARINSSEGKTFSEVYIFGEGWNQVDVYNPDKKFGECVICEEKIPTISLI